MDHSSITPNDDSQAISQSESSFTAAISSSSISSPKSSSPKYDKTKLISLNPIIDLRDNTCNTQVKGYCNILIKDMSSVITTCTKLLYLVDSKNVMPSQIFTNKKL